MTQFGRVAVVEIGRPGRGGVRLSTADGPLRVAFTAQHTSESKPTQGSVTLYNATDAIVGHLRQPDAVVRVLAGYTQGGGAGTVLAGTVITDGLRDSTDGITRTTVARLADGGASLRQTYGSIGYAGRVVASTLVRDLADRLGVVVGSLQLGQDTVYQRGWTFAGPLRRALPELARDTRSIITVTDGRLTAYPRGGQRRTTGYLFAPSSGLLDARRTAEGCEVRTLLVSPMRPGDRYRVESRLVVGDYVCTAVTHSGDTEAAGAGYVSVITGRTA